MGPFWRQQTIDGRPKKLADKFNVAKRIMNSPFHSNTVLAKRPVSSTALTLASKKLCARPVLPAPTKLAGWLQADNLGRL